MLKVSRSGYYGCLGREPSARTVADAQLSAVITVPYSAVGSTAGITLRGRAPRQLMPAAPPKWRSQNAAI